MNHGKNKPAGNEGEGTASTRGSNGGETVGKKKAEEGV